MLCTPQASAHRACCIVGLALLSVVACAGEPDKPKDAGLFLMTGSKILDAAECRTKALDAEKTEDWAAALTAWERVIDRCPSTEAQLPEARAHIRSLRVKVSRNADPEKARPWKVLAVIFRQLDFSWTDAQGKTIEVHKTVSADDEKKIRGSLDAFRQHVLRFSSGMLRLDVDIKVIDEPLTKLAGQKDGKPPFSPAPHLLRPFIDPLIKDQPYDTVMAYVKYNGDQGPAVPAPFVAATFGSIRDVNGAGFIMVPWHTNYPFPGETDGEMELHEWLHQIQWMFGHVLRYPEPVTQNPDGGRMEGDKRPGGDTEYARKKSETTWIRFYQHIMEDHITRQMWSEATMRLPKDQPPPGEMLKPKK